MTFPPSALAQSEVSGQLAGVVFADGDGDGRRGPGEAGIAGVIVCSRSECAATDEDGAYEVEVEPGYRVVWVRQPDGLRAAREFWRRVPADPFVLITGDLIRDALRVPEETARERFELFRKEKNDFPVPVWVVPGNHENFGIERERSGVSEDNPLYGKAMYRRFLGPTYYSFDYGGVHFVALDTVDIEDQWYYAHVDATQMSWLDEDLSTVAAETPVVTFNHIPLFSAAIPGWNFYPDGGSVIDIDGKAQYRHMVSNYAEILERFVGRNYPLALGGHGHAREEILLGDRRFTTRFHQTSAVVGDAGEREGMEYVSGVTLYNIDDGAIAGWEFIPIDGGSPSR